MKLPIDTNILPRKKGVYIVGGSIRDLIANRKPADYDMAIAHDPGQFARSLAANTDGHVVEIGKHGHTILRVVAQDIFFDISPLNGGSIEEDLHRRDFTLNAMALDLSSGILIDPLNGREDMAKGLVRMVSSDVFRKDPVRLIRAYRMAATFGFRLPESTSAVIRQDADLIGESPGERIREELFKIFQIDGSHVQITHMASSGVLFSILPEMRLLKSCRANGPQSSSVFERALKSYDFLERLLGSHLLSPTTPANYLYKEMEADRAAVLKCAVLLHDIGRPAVRRVDTAAGARFYGHAAKSAVMARAVCERLRCSKRQTQTIEFIIRHHERPFFLFKARPKEADAKRGFIRFFMKCGRLTPDVLLLTLADAAGRCTAGGTAVPDFSKFIVECLDRYYATLAPRATRPLPLNGYDLINVFHLKPSPLFKRMLTAVAEENLARPNFSRSQALEMVKAKLDQIGADGTNRTD